MARAGFELLAKGDDRSGETARVTYGSEKSSLTPVMTDAVKRFTPDQQSLWKVFSGATHSQGWLVSGLGGPIEELFASILTPLLDTGDALAVEVGRYFGMNRRETVSGCTDIAVCCCDVLDRPTARCAASTTFGPHRDSVRSHLVIRCLRERSKIVRSSRG